VDELVAMFTRTCHDVRW